MRFLFAQHIKNLLLPFQEVRALCCRLRSFILWIFSWITERFGTDERKRAIHGFDRLADSKKCKIKHGEGMLKNDRSSDWSANDERWISRDSDSVLLHCRSAREQRTFVWSLSKHEKVIASCPQSISQFTRLATAFAPAHAFVSFFLVPEFFFRCQSSITDAMDKSKADRKIIISAISCRLRIWPENAILWTKEKKTRRGDETKLQATAWGKKSWAEHFKSFGSLTIKSLSFFWSSN